MKNEFYFLIIWVCFHAFSGCNDPTVREHIVSETTYTYLNDTIDSTTVVVEHFFLNHDSVITKYISHKNGYFYTVDYDEEARVSKQKYFTLDSTLLYSSITSNSKDGVTKEIEFLDAHGNTTYRIVNTYDEEGSLLLMQQREYSDGSIQQQLYEYDQHGTEVKRTRVLDQDTVILVYHRVSYDSLGRLVNDTIYHPRRREIIQKEYKNNRLFFVIEREEHQSCSDSCYIPAGNTYWKRYYSYNDEGYLAEIRNIEMFLYTRGFRMDSRVEIDYYRDGRVARKRFFNSKDQLVSLLQNEYKYSR